MDCAGTAGTSGRLIDHDVRPGLDRDGTAGRLGRRDHGVWAALNETAAIHRGTWERIGVAGRGLGATVQATGDRLSS
jgi:hypothetical protein